MEKEKNLIWIDLEMTGLDPTVDTILEIASIVTDSQLNIIAEGPSLIIKQPESALEHMDEWVFDTHTKSGLVDQVRKSSTSLQQAEEETLIFLEKYCWLDKSPLCGNSVWQDKNFMRAHMPRLAGFFYYRIIDVTSIKECVLRWYPEIPEFEKKDTHRALEDIKESIAELQWYRERFFVSE